MARQRIKQAIIVENRALCYTVYDDLENDKGRVCMLRSESSITSKDFHAAGSGKKWSVRLVVPALEDFFLTIRLTTSGVCAKAGMDIECVEDMKTAVAEACYCFVNQSSGCESLEVIYNCDAEFTSVIISALNRNCDRAPKPRMKYMPDVAIGILHTLVDGAEVSGDDLGFKQIRLLMRNIAANHYIG